MNRCTSTNEVRHSKNHGQSCKFCLNYYYLTTFLNIALCEILRLCFWTNAKQLCVEFSSFV
jgi:hypothetical protein